MTREARVTSRVQVTMPRDIRRALGVRSGDTILFEKFRGIGNPGIPSGKAALLRYFRRLRGR
jgi:bifunctional DNA-binding transcriptional regulator/antitoxin component of YhaV-PrlF toxin-antitoxin module